MGKNRIASALRALPVLESLGDARAQAVAQINLAGGYYQTGKSAGDIEEAERAIDEACRLFRETGTELSLYCAIALGWRGSILARLKRFDEGREAYANAIATFRAFDDEDRAAKERSNAADLEFMDDDPATALSMVKETLDALRVGATRAFQIPRSHRIIALGNAAAYAIALNSLGEASDFAFEALDEAKETLSAGWTAFPIQHVATIAALQGNAECAARLAGYVDSVLSREGAQREPTEQRAYEILDASLNEQLQTARRAALEREGARLSDEQAIAVARSAF
jgi:hypothetical protein